MDTKLIGKSVSDYFCFNQRGGRIFSALDSKFQHCAGIQCEEYYVPGLIDAETIKKCGYFETFPQHLTIAAPVSSSCYASTVCTEKNISQNLEYKRRFFTPAACLHFYPMLENMSISKETALTTRARVYRYESGNFDNMTRLWDFTVRELLFVGTPDYVRKQLQFVSNWATNFANRFGPATLQWANDHFYPTKRNLALENIQRNSAVKSELQVNYKQHTISLASFNYHGFHFSKLFNFDSNGTIASGCVGFGLERWCAFCSETTLSFEELIDEIKRN